MESGDINVAVEDKTPGLSETASMLRRVFEMEDTTLEQRQEVTHVPTLILGAKHKSVSAYRPG